MNYKINFQSQDYLEHHGILGQRWGHRNGPPYPLDSEDHSSSEKKAGWKKSLKGETATSVVNDTLSKTYKTISNKSSEKHPHVSKAASDMSKDYANKAEKSRQKYAQEKEEWKNRKKSKDEQPVSSPKDYINPDGSLTKKGEKEYAKAISASKEYGAQLAVLERMTRYLTDGVPKGTQILVPSETKKAYSDALTKLNNLADVLNKNFGEVTADVRSMDDGYDYYVTYLQDKKLDGYIEYYTLIGETRK